MDVPTLPREGFSVMALAVPELVLYSSLFSVPLTEVCLTHRYFFKLIFHLLRLKVGSTNLGLMVQCLQS